MRYIPHVLIAGLAVGVSPSFAQEQIIPKPVSIEITEGAAIALTNDSRIFVDASNADLLKQAQFILAELKEGTGLAIEIIDSSKAKMKAGANDIIMRLDASLADKGEEAYSISAGPEGIVMSAPNVKGLFYAFSSLSQMLPTAFHDAKVDKKAVAWTVAAKPFTIVDYPRFGWRSFMLDDARYFFGMDQVKLLLDQLALLKMNIFHWGLTNDEGWRLEIKKYPRLTSVGGFRKQSEMNGWNSGKYDGTPHGGFYTQEQVKEIVAYAAARNITVVPEINGPSHFGAGATAYPEISLSSPTEVPVKFAAKIAVDPTNEYTYKFMDDVYEEVVQLFPSEVIHTGGDEVRYSVQWQGKPSIEKFMKEKNITSFSDLQLYYSNRISDILKKKGRRMMGWNEIMGHDVNGEGGGTGLGELDKHAVVHFWKGNPKLAREAIARGYDVVNSNHGQTYLDYGYGSISIRKAYEFEPVFEGLTEEEAKKVIGFGCQMWTEWTPTIESMNQKAFPRTVAYAEAGWTPVAKKDYNEFKVRLEDYSKRMDSMGILYAKDIPVNILSVTDFNEIPKVAEWNQKTDFAEIMDLDVTSHMSSEGEYVVTLLGTKGKGGLYTLSVALYEDGKEIAMDNHKSRSGLKIQDKSQYSLKVDKVNPQAKYSLRLKFIGPQKKEHSGNIYFDAP